MEMWQPCTDTTDLTEFSLHHNLYLKPEAKLSISVALPNVRLPGKTITNWEVMERLRETAQPDEFQIIKVSKSTLEFIRFDAEIENRTQIRSVISKLDGKSIKLSGFPEPLKVRAAEAKPDFPTRHEWDRYFRDAKNMNEMKPGERPDTIYLQGLPCKWFAYKRSDSDSPNENVLQQVFQVFGEVRFVDIPILDPYRKMMKASISGVQTFSHSTNALFDAYVQYREYICFVKAMDSLRGMKLVYKDGIKAFSISIKVDFDKTKHLSDMSIRRRAVDREKLVAKERELEAQKRMEEDAVKRAMEEEEHKKLQEKQRKGERRKEREEKRKQRILKKLKKKEVEEMNTKIAIEERKLLMAQRKLESIRLLDELFERVKIEKQKELMKQKEVDNQLSKQRSKNDGKHKKKDKESRKKDKMLLKEKHLRKKLVNKIKFAQEQQMEERREKLRKTIAGKNKSVSKLGDGEGNSFGAFEFSGIDYNPALDPYQGFGYSDWSHRGSYRGRYFPRRPFRGTPYLSSLGGYHAELKPPSSSEWKADSKKEKKSGADDMGSSGSDSGDSTDYSKLDSSEEKEKKSSKKDIWPGYEANLGTEGLPPTHPWAGYSDYYNPRFIRRGGRRGTSSYRGWPLRGGFGTAPNSQVPMNSFYMHSINSQYSSERKTSSKKEKRSGADDMEKGSSDSDSDDSSNFQSDSSVTKGKRTSKTETWPGYEANLGADSLPSSHPWVGYSDYYNPRFMRRGGRRGSSVYRGWPQRGGFGTAPNPQVPMNSFYMHSINSQYYRYFNRLAKGENKSERSRSNSSERVVCRKVLSRSRSRGKSYSKSRSRSKSKSRSNSKEKSTKKDSRSRSPSVSRRSSKERTKSKSKSPHKSVEKKAKNAFQENKQSQKERMDSKNRNEDNDKELSDLSLSLSESEDWSRGSPERKARPLGDPNWEPSDRRFRRARHFNVYDRSFPKYHDVRSHVTRPNRRSKSQSPSRRSVRHDRRRSQEKIESRKRSRSRSSRERRTKYSKSDTSEDEAPTSRKEKRHSNRTQPSSSKSDKRDQSVSSKSRHKSKKGNSKSHDKHRKKVSRHSDTD